MILSGLEWGLLAAALAVVAFLAHRGGSKPGSTPPTRDNGEPALPSRGSSVFSSQSTLTPLRFGKWRLVERVGKGGTSVVYRAVPINAEDTIEASVAIKIFESKMTQNADFRRRFDREVKACHTLEHPSMVQLIDSGERDGRIYMVMELLRGKSLRGHLKGDGEGLSIEQFMGWMRPLLEGITYAHARGIVHRDLKPENVIVVGPEQVKIVDFGIAHGFELDNITTTGRVIGTVAYIPMERMQGVSDDPRSDQYALGVMAYEMLAGRRPFVDNLSVLPYMQGDPPALDEIRPEVPPDLADVIARMMARDREDRYETLQEAFDDMLAAVGDPQQTFES